MNAALRHLSVRTWLTALTGGLACFSLLPLWQQALGVDWLACPAFFIMMVCFAGVGWGMNRIGLGFLKRHVDEATVWERAGMIAEAESAFQKAMATFDSFWLSPLLRRGRLQWFSGLMARFYLGHHSNSTFIRNLIATHMKHFPQDMAAAEPWLEQLLAFETHLPQEHEAVACVSQRQAKHQRMQRLLMQFYLANGRVDFDALQTYRRVWSEQQQQPIPNDTLHNLARLLRNEYFLNHWALQVYLKAHESGDNDAIEGIAAAVRWLPLTEESRSHLDMAQKIVGELGPEKSAALDSRYKPVQEPVHAKETARLKQRTRPSDKRSSKELVQEIVKRCNQFLDWVLKFCSDRRVLRAFAASAVIAVVVGVTGVVGWHYFRHQPTQQVAVPEEAAEVEIKITDPFTIQVAAYLKSGDAQRYVDDLRQKELDAFWTQATNANRRTWYQVKVSHFADRQGAETYGQELKSRGMIDDFYVANYEHALRNDVKK